MNIKYFVINLKLNSPFDSANKQKGYLDLVKLYLICATPYLADTDVESYEKKMDQFILNKKSQIKNKTQRIAYEFNPKLDKNLDKIMIDLQKKLRPVFAKRKDEDDDEGL